MIQAIAYRNEKDSDGTVRLMPVYFGGEGWGDKSMPGKWTEEKLDRFIKLANSVDAEELEVRIAKDDKDSLKCLDGCGFIPLYEANGKYIYSISFRQGLTSLHDFLRTKSRSIRAKAKWDVLWDIRKHRNLGIYKRHNIEAPESHAEPKFITFWGTNTTGKSSMIKELMRYSSIHEIQDPYYTLLGDGILVIGTYKASVRTGGMDTLAGSCSYGYGMKLLSQLWRMKDIKVILMEGHIGGNRMAVVRELVRNYERFQRKMIIYHCDCSLDIIKERLKASTGKELEEYSGGGHKIKLLKERVPRVLREVVKTYPYKFEIRKVMTDQMTLWQRFDTFKRELE